MMAESEKEHRTVQLVKPKGVLWNHFGFQVNEKVEYLDKKSVRCTLCDKPVAYSGNTTNLKQHLQIHHPEALPCVPGPSSSVPQQVKLSDVGLMPKGKLPSGGKRAQKITESLAHFIAKDMRPVSIIEGEGFLEFVSAMEPAYSVPSRKTMTTYLQKLYGDIKVRVQGELDESDHVGITTDCWTSAATESYMSVTAHYVTPQWHMACSILQCRAVTERHTIGNIAVELQCAATEWRLESKLSAATTDNARNVVGAVRQLNWRHIPCFGHTLQIGVQAGLHLPSVTAIVARAKKIVGHFRHSCIATTALHQKQKALNLPEHKLVQDVVTRWNSTFEMLDRLLEQQTAISTVLVEGTNSRNRDLVPTNIELIAMQQIVDVLRPLSSATTLLCGEKHPSLSLVMPTLTALLKKHLATSEVEPQIVVSLKSTISLSLTEHFSDSGLRRFLLLAAVLDPRFKSLKFISSSKKATVFADLQRAAVEIQIQEGSQSQEDGEESLVSLLPHPKRQKKWQELFDYTESSSNSDSSSPSHDTSCAVEREVAQYRADEQLKQQCNPLEWWKSNVHRYKVLSQLARKFFSIPATSVPSERLFSAAGNIVSAKRASLSPKNVECLVFLNKNL